jgi:hypothetical protein
METQPPRLPPGLPRAWAVMIAAFLVQLPLALMPGYFSHDELQWAWRADTVPSVPWWDDRTTFQFRPLTFNLWLALSRALFDTPVLFHSVLVVWGTANATLLFAIGRRMRMRPWPAAIGALAFVLTPYAAYAHGWVGTIADLVWLTCALLVAWCAVRLEHRAWIFVAAFVFAMTGVLGKEAAAAIPVACAVAVVLDVERRGRWAAAMLGSGLAIASFLAWRLPALLHAPRDGGAQYVPSIANIPVRWFEYQVFAPIVPLFEVHATLMRTTPVLIAAALWCALIASLWQAHRRLALAFVFGGLAMLSPVLLLGSSANHYAYGFAAVSTMCAAAAWPKASRFGRVAIGTFATLTALHGVSVMLQMSQVARVQSVFSPALAEALSTHDGVLRLRPASNAKPWIFLRLTHAIPAYRGIPIGDRVRIVGDNEPADFTIQADGHLRPAR